MVDPSSFQIRAQKIGENIQEARIATGKKEVDCAKAMGLGLSDYQSFEQGQEAISLPELEVLAFYLDIPIDHFLGRETISLETQEKVTVNKLENSTALTSSDHRHYAEKSSHRSRYIARRTVPGLRN